MARAQRQPIRSSSISFTFSGHQDNVSGGPGGGSELKVCPRCSVLIVKMDDGSCNHMTCAVCGSEFCWLCMKEISDLHYLSPSGNINNPLNGTSFNATLSFRLYLLGQKTLEQKKEVDVAVRNSGWGSSGDCPDCRHLHPRHDHRDPRLGGQEDPQQISDFWQTQEKYCHH